MVNAATVKGLVERYAKAEALVAEQAVFPIAGLAGYAVVKNGNGSQFYLVRHEDGHEHCTCPDFTQRQEARALPCKHILVAQLAAEQAAKPTKAKRGMTLDQLYDAALS